MKRQLCFILALILCLPMLLSIKAFAANDYYIEDNSYDLDDYLAWSNGASTVKLCADLTGVGTTNIGPEITELLGWVKNLFDGDQPKQRTIKDSASGSITITAGSDITIRNIIFDVANGLNIAKDATVVFEDCTFAQTITNDGTATFLDCTFRTGKIENNGAATYIGETVEPENIGTPSGKTPLAINLTTTSLVDAVKGVNYQQEIAFALSGDSKDSAQVTANITPADRGITASVQGEKVLLSGTPVTTGEYTVTITAAAGGEEVSKKITFSVNEKISAELVGALDAVTVGQTGYQCYLDVYVTEGQERLSYYDYCQKYPFASIQVSISPNNSGMNASYLFDQIVVSGTPAKDGTYQVTATITNNGQQVTTNASELRIYLDNQTLQQRFDALPQGTTSWDMEPYEIAKCADSVVPVELQHIYGSHESGLYGIIGNNQSDGTETLTIPAGCSVVIENMKVYSSVRIIVEKGGSLTLRDSVAFGPVIVNGGTFSMDRYAALTDSLTLNDGSILKDAVVDSNSRYLTDGNTKKADVPTVVIVNGIVTALGQNIITGDDGSGSVAGQNALQVNGHLVIPKDASVTAIGGGSETFYPSVEGGDGVKLDGGTILGQGSLTAQGGYGHFGDGGHGISGKGNITVDTLVSKGGDSLALGLETDRKTGGDAVTAGVMVSSKNVTVTGGSGSTNGSAAITRPTSGMADIENDFVYEENNINSNATETDTKNPNTGDNHLFSIGVALLLITVSSMICIKLATKKYE